MIITASIVTYHNPLTELKKVIDSFLNSSVNGLLFIVDNSSDRSIEKIITDKRINYIFNDSNIGFGKAHNIAIRKSEELNSDFHLILNPDIEFDTYVIESIIEKFQTDRQIGLIMPKIVYPDGATQYLCKLIPTPLNLFARRFLPFKSLVARQNEKYELRFFTYENEAEIPSLSGCFMMIRTSVLTEVNGFDERYFMYLEDVDLCRKIGEKSKLLFYPRVQITHNFEKGSYKDKKLLNYHITSSIHYFNKWGWIFDRKRKIVNRKTLSQLGYFEK